MTYKDEVLADAPALYWRLSERAGTVAVDSSGHGFDGTYQPGCTLGQASLVVSEPGDSAVRLDGVTGYVVDDSTTNLSARDRTTFTIECWVQTTEDPPSSEERHLLSKPKAAFSAYALLLHGLAPGLPIVRFGKASNSIVQVTGSAIINDGLTHHIVGVRDVDGARVYVDGVERGFQPDVSAIEDDEIAFFHVGRHPDIFTAATVDEVALYFSALPAARVAAHYAAGLRLWPTTLPAALLVAGFGAAAATTAIRTQIEGGVALMRNRMTTGAAPFNGALAVTRDQVEIFDDFFSNILNDGVLPFRWIDPLRKVPLWCRFTNVPVYTAVSPEVWNIRVELETLP